MTESDEGLFNPPKFEKPPVNPAREVTTDPDILDPQRRNRKKRLQASVVTQDFAPPILSETGLLGFGSENA